MAAWREALRLDPGNFTIRKQIWSVEHSERFYPSIDFDWQGVQLAAKRERERFSAQRMKTKGLQPPIKEVAVVHGTKSPIAISRTTVAPYMLSGFP